MRNLLAVVTTTAMLLTATVANAQPTDGTAAPSPLELSENQLQQPAAADLPQKAYPPVYYGTAAPVTATTPIQQGEYGQSFMNDLQQLNF